MPYWEKLDYEFDLMVNRPEDVVEHWVETGATRIILHVESKGNIDEAISKLEDKAEVGIALNMDTPIEIIEKYSDKITVVQLMAINQIGFQGQEFNEGVLERIRAVKSKYPQLAISVDGGVNLHNAKALIEAGADRLIVGSAIFGADNPIDEIQKFNRI